jgi:uncharacterized protein (DUF697 family)
MEEESEDFLELEDEDEDEDFLGGVLDSVLGGELEGLLPELEERELAGELLEVQSEEELEQFLGNLVRKATRGVGNFVKSSTGQALGGMLKGLAKRALPVVGGALGSMVAPGVGTAIGSKLGSMAGGLFELEGEVGEGELEFEVARRVVRIGTTAAHRAALARPVAPAPVLARRAILAATRAHAPAALPSSVHPRFRTRHPIAVARPVGARRYVARPGGRRVPVGGARRPVGYRRPGGPVRVRPGAPYRRGTGVRRVARPGTYGRTLRPRGVPARLPGGVYRRVPRSWPGGPSGVRRAGYGRRVPGGAGSPARVRRPGGPGGRYGRRGFVPGGYGQMAPYTAIGTWVRRGDRIILLGV